MKKRLREGAKLIVVDPRRIDIVRSPHVEAQYLPAAAARHQRRRADRDGARDRHRGPRGRAVRARRAATWTRSRNGRRSSPTTGTRPRPLRSTRASRPRTSARPRASTPPVATAAIYYGLGVTEHSRGSTTVLAIANLAMATGNLGPARRGRESAARPEQRPGRLRHGLVPARASRATGTSRTRPRARSSSRCGERRSNAEPGLRIPNMLDAAVDGTFKAPLRAGRRHPAVGSGYEARQRGHWRPWSAWSSTTSS